MIIRNSLAFPRLSVKQLSAAPMVAFLVACNAAAPKPEAPKSSTPTAMEVETIFGGRKAVTLRLPDPATGEQSKTPYFTGADILPGRGMNTYQIRAYIPGKGVIDLLEAPPMEAGAKLMSGGPGDEYGNEGFKMGGGILFPFANRIRGKVSSDGKSIETKVLDTKLRLDANWKGKEPAAEPHAMHGMILGRSVASIQTSAAGEEASVTGTIDFGEFTYRWPGKPAATITTAIRPDRFILTVVATNNGKDDMPVGVGWHPYFRVPSGNRDQVKLYVPAAYRAEVDNYDNVFPTGKRLPLAGTPQDFSMPGGAALAKIFLDDCYVDLKKNDQGQAIAEFTDPAAHYGLRLRGISPEISAFQVYAPPDRQIVVIEPQFNWGDPFSKIWKGTKTGMVILKPGQSVTYKTEVELFVP